MTTVACHKSLSMSATDLLNEYGAKDSNVPFLWVMQGFEFDREYYPDANGQYTWSISEQGKQRVTEELEDSQVCRVIHALTCCAAPDIVAESLNLR